MQFSSVQDCIPFVNINFDPVQYQLLGLPSQWAGVLHSSWICIFEFFAPPYPVSGAPSPAAYTVLGAPEPATYDREGVPRIKNAIRIECVQYLLQKYPHLAGKYLQG